MQRRTFVKVLVSGACAVAGGAAGGCYRRVVNATGPTSDSYDVYEPNLKDEEVNESFWGDGKKSSKSKKK
jgi:hypothetical protein